MSKEWFGTETDGEYPLCICCLEFDYAQTCTRPDISFAIDMLGRKAAKKVLWYLQGIRNRMLTYKKFDHLEVIRYTDSDFVGCMDKRKSTFGYVYLLAGGVISWESEK